MQAMRGRASYTGERSIGSLDAGAMAVAVMAERVAEDWPAPSDVDASTRTAPVNSDPAVMT